jgi:hypothetical protein
MDFEEILGSLVSSMLFIFLLYIKYLIIVVFSVGEMLASMRRIGYGVLPLLLRL